MANQKQKFILCIVLLAITTSTTSLDLDDKTKQKISELVGQKQFILRRYLDEIKSQTDKFEDNIRRITAEASGPFWKENNKRVDDVKAHAVGKPEKTECINQMNQGIKEKLKTEIERYSRICVAITKPGIHILKRATHNLAVLEYEIKNSPKTCMESNNDVESLLKCIKELLDNYETEMVDRHNEVNYNIQLVDKQVNGLENSLKVCRTESAVTIQRAANEIKDQFDECVKS